MRYAKVAVDMSFRQKLKLLSPSPRSDWDADPPPLRTFHYEIPPAFEADIALGQLVWVPFGKQQAQGIVVAFDTVAPVPELRQIIKIVADIPSLTATQIELARWMSLYYLSPFFDSLSLMLPLGVARQAKAWLAIAETAELPDRLSPDERAAWEVLQAEGPLPLTEANARLGRMTVARMFKKGWLVRQEKLPPPRIRPRVVEFVRLALPAERARERFSELHRAPKQGAVINALLERGAPLPASELRQATCCSMATLKTLQQSGWITLEERTVWRDPLVDKEFVLTSAPPFTEGQEQVWMPLSEALMSDEPHVFLLHGVTGSGKTEIYMRAVTETLKRGKQAIILVPEIALTPQTIGRFAARFPGRLAVLHSQLAAGERHDEWRRIRSGLAEVVIGPRSALFAPLTHLGLIVIDEEHESSYKQETIPGQALPCYHARDVAINLGQLTGAQVILGSATPSLLSFARAERGEYKLLTLPRRVMGHREQWSEQRVRFQIQQERYRGKELTETQEIAPQEAATLEAQYLDLPPVQIVDLRRELFAGNRSIFSRTLQAAIAESLAAQEQVILFLNRRGSSTFVMCRDCGYVAKCPHCAIPLTYHADRDRLICHRCAFQSPTPADCPACKSKRIRFFGIGTQKVEEVTRQLFPAARILRWDSDVINRGNSQEAIWQRFADHEADILIGTQMVAKGLDLPLVTLVGVISADTALHLPDYVAAERTFQLLAQVAGRAGRSILGGKVIVQSYSPEHYAIQTAAQHDYEGFYRQEMAFRREQWYPPFSRLAKLTIVDQKEDQARRKAEQMLVQLREHVAQLALSDLDIIGPAPCFFSPWQGLFRWQIILRSHDPHALLKRVALPPGWRVDIDPISTL